jgi:predicted RNase H-like nuclease
MLPFVFGVPVPTGAFTGVGGVMEVSAFNDPTVAGVEPVPGGWLIAPGALQGTIVTPQPAYVLSALSHVLDHRPSFEVIALHAPVGASRGAGDLRACDVAARNRLGRRAGAVVPAPSRAVLEAQSYEEAHRIDPTLDIVRWRSLAKAAEAIREVQSWRQQVVWEVNPELALTMMNDGKPIPFGRRSPTGRQIRRQLVEENLPGADRVLKERPMSVREEKLIDALADLWTARRVVSRAVTRMSELPVWDDAGVRLDIVS